jgi:alkyl hydroperoxide reductase subunit AhpF
MIPDRERALIRERFEAELKTPVQIDLFVRPESGLFIPGRPPTTSKEARQLLEEVAALSDLIALRVVDVTAEPEAAAAADVTGVPAIIIRGPEDGRVRMLGLPAGYEFATLIETIASVSSGETGIDPSIVEILDALPDPVDIQVFVTPT